MAVATERGLVDDSLDSHAFGAEMLSTGVAESGMLMAYECAAVFTDRPSRALAQSAFSGLVPDHLSGRALKDLAIGPASGLKLDCDYGHVEELDPCDGDIVWVSVRFAEQNLSNLGLNHLFGRSCWGDCYAVLHL